MAKILLVEDDLALCSMMQKWLQFEHHTVETAHDGQAGLENLRFYKYDVIILDWELPKMSGPEVCRQFRATGGTSPVIMLTGKNTVDDKIEGLESGADDYLTKPFNMKELSARLRAVLRRPSEYKGDGLKSGTLLLDAKTMRVTRDNKEVSLSQAEFALLQFLMRNHTQVFSPEALLDRIWHSSSDVSPAAIRTHIKNVRKKIDVDGEDSLIRNVHGVGYCFNGPVEG
jgi:DNA-binding response OmpR family regulator